MIFNLSSLPSPGGSQIPLVPGSCDSWEETIYTMPANKTAAPAVSAVPAADIWNTPELPQLAKHSPTRQVKFGLISSGRGWPGTGQSPCIPQDRSLIKHSFVSPSAPRIEATGTRDWGCFPHRIWSLDVSAKGSALPRQAHTHPTTTCWFYVPCPHYLRVSVRNQQSWPRVPPRHGWKKSQRNTSLCGTAQAEPPSWAECRLLPRRTSSFLWGRHTGRHAGLCCEEPEGKEPRPPCQKLLCLV